MFRLSRVSQITLTYRSYSLSSSSNDQWKSLKRTVINYLEDKDEVKVVHEGRSMTIHEKNKLILDKTQSDNLDKFIEKINKTSLSLQQLQDLKLYVNSSSPTYEDFGSLLIFGMFSVVIGGVFFTIPAGCLYISFNDLHSFRFNTDEETRKIAVRVRREIISGWISSDKVDNYLGKRLKEFDEVIKPRRNTLYMWYIMYCVGLTGVGLMINNGGGPD